MSIVKLSRESQDFLLGRELMIFKIDFFVESLHLY